jgi:hypothetical protein
MSPTGPRYPTTTTTTNGSGGNGNWANPANQYASDGAVASAGYLLDVTNTFSVSTVPLTSGGFGFAIPTGAIIDGIKLEVNRTLQTNLSEETVYLRKAGATTGTNKAFAGVGASPIVYGGPTDLWGASWTPADINNANFGASLTFNASHGPADFNCQIDYVRITVYWHTAPAEVPKRYLYKTYDNATGTYLGNLPNVISEFTFPQDINTAGAQLVVECGVTIDTSSQATDVYTDAAGNPYTDEAASQNYTTEGVAPPVATGLSGLAVPIKNGNRVVVWEYSYYYPNGIAMFSGQINNWAATETVKLLLLSDGLDLDNLTARGAPFTYTSDQSQTLQNSSESVNASGGKGGFYNKSGQSFKTGAAVTNIGAITLMLNGSANVTVRVYDTPLLGTLKGSTSQSVSVAGPTAIQFAFATPIVVTANTNYFISVEVDDGQSILIYYQSTDVYANGAHYQASFAGSGGGSFGSGGGITGDLYFVTGTSAGSTTGTYTSQDPSTGMLKPIIDDYKARGGLINYATGTVDATGLSLTYTFNTNTVFEALKACLSMAPNGFYYYIDIGTNTLYFKTASIAADITLVKGKHIGDFELGASIENIKNLELFSGGATAGVNLYKQYQDQTSIDAYGVRLNRRSDNRVTVTATADAMGTSDIAQQKDEQYHTTLTVYDRTMDITTLTPGKIIGFAGYGTFIDSLLLQIVRREYHPLYVKLTLGMLPKRLGPEIESITRGLLAAQTVANPTAPS